MNKMAKAAVTANEFSTLSSLFEAQDSATDDDQDEVLEEEAVEETEAEGEEEVEEELEEEPQTTQSSDGDDSEDEGEDEEEAASASEDEESDPQAEEEVEEDQEEEAETSSEEETEEGPEEDQEELLAQYNEFMEEARTRLETEVYNLSEEDSEALQDDPAAVLPMMAARLHMQIAETVMQNIARQFPQMMETYTTQSEQTSAFETQFFERWPDLQGDKAEVVKIGQVYRQLNPSATTEDFIRDVGAQVTVALGKHVAAEPAKGNKPRRRSLPPRPAAAGTTSRSKPAVETNEFTILAEMDEL